MSIWGPATVRRPTICERRALFERHGGKCHWCGCVMNWGGNDYNLDPLWFTVDHLVQVCLGGVTAYWNCVAACRRCNQSRPKRTPKAPPNRLKGAETTKTDIS